MKIVEVTWLDACSSDQWENKTDVKKSKQVIKGGTLCKSAGYLIVDNKKSIVVSCSHDTVNDNVSGTMHIPKNCVKKIRVLK